MWLFNFSDKRIAIIYSNSLLTVTSVLFHSFPEKNKKGAKTLPSRTMLSNAFWYASSKSPGSKKVPLSVIPFPYPTPRENIIFEHHKNKRYPQINRNSELSVWENKSTHAFTANKCIFFFFDPVIRAFESVMMCALRFTGSCWGAVLRTEPGHATAGEENPLPHTFLQPQSHARLGGGPYTVSN